VANRNIYCQILLLGNISLQNNASNMFLRGLTMPNKYRDEAEIFDLQFKRAAI